MTMIEIEDDKIALFPHGAMAEADFDRERARLRGLYGDSRKEAGARYEQALAKLFYVSGWTLERLAKKEGKTKSKISQMMIFGRFLGFLENSPESNLSTTVDKPEKAPLGLTERFFRGFWLQTDGGSGSSGGNERTRFVAVIRLMQEAALAPKPKNRGKEVGKAIASQFADGKWRDVETIAKQTGEHLDDVKPALQNIIEHKTFQCTAQKRPFANGPTVKDTSDDIEPSPQQRKPEL
jgi:hypothetical protein